MDTSERLVMLGLSGCIFRLRIMGLLQDVFRKMFMLLVHVLAHYRQPYLFKFLQSPQFYPSPQQLERLLAVHSDAKVLQNRIFHTYKKRGK